MKRHTLLAPLVGLGLVLAACGGDGNTAIDPLADPTADTASSVDSSEPGDNLRSPTPIKAVSSGQQSGSIATATPASAEADIATSDMMIAPFIAEYVLADDFPALPTDDVGYVFDGSVVVSAEQVTMVAAAFGVGGEPVRVDAFSWRVGPDDGSAPTVWVSTDAQQSWSYNGPWDDGAVVDACAVSIDSEGNESGDCPEPTPPAGVPSADAAEQRARESLAALGVEAAALTFETFADEWSANVTADDRTSDRPAIRFWNFGYGAEGVLQWAGGSLAMPQPVGPYPLVDLDTAVGRLRDQGGFGVPMPLLDGPAPVAENEAGAGGVAADEGDDVVTAETLVADEPLPVDPQFDREAITITLVEVQADLWWAWDADNTVWLVPAYRFIDADGGWHTVPAVTDEFLIQIEPSVVGGPIPIEPDGGIGDGAEPLPPPESLPVPPDDEPVDIRPVDDPETALAVLGEYVGLSIEEFTAEAKTLGFETRIVEQDGESLAVTADFSETRVNVVVEGPRVTGLESIG